MNRLSLSDNQTIARNLTPKAKRYIRLAHIFKNIANVIYRDVRQNPVKLLCFSTFPTTTTCLTLAFIGAGLTKNARDNRTLLMQGFTGDIAYKLYQNFLNARFDGQYDVDGRVLRRYMMDQGRCHMMQGLYEESGRFRDGWVKSIIQKNLRKRMVKGELTLVS